MTEPSIIDRAYRVLSRIDAQDIDDKQPESPQDQSDREESK